MIASNTTLSRPAAEVDQAGGLSGEPLRWLSLHAIRTLATAARGRLAIIGVGGIAASEHAADALRAGADLLQVYTGLVYRGPALVRELLNARL